MKKLLALTFGALLFAGFTATSHAQVAPTAAVDPGHPRVNEVDRRERHQDSRIANGQRTGELTRRETRNLDRRENSIQRDKARDMRADGGHLTKHDQRQLNRRQNRVSRAIYRKKHNGRVQ